MVWATAWTTTTYRHRCSPLSPPLPPTVHAVLGVARNLLDFACVPCAPFAMPACVASLSVRHPGPWVSTLLAATLSMAWPTAHAQSRTLAAQTVLEHRVAVGDTLETLALRYLGDATLWPQLQAHNRVSSPYRLQPGSVLHIPLQLMRTATASVDYVQGNARVQRTSAPNAPLPPSAPLQPGMPLQEGDRLQLDPDAFVTVRLADGSTVRVQAQSQLQLSQLRRRGRAGSLQSVLELQQGGIQVQVPPQRNTARRLDVLTPVAATSVRGTVFDVQLADDGRTSTAVERGRVGMQGTASHPTITPVSAGHGMAVGADGRAGQPVALLPAPAADSLPTLNEDAQWLQLPLPTAPAASAWRVQVARDVDGLHVVRNGVFAPGTARFAAVEDGAYFVQLRAVDGHGISGWPAQGPLRVKAHPVPPLVQGHAPGGVLPAGHAQLQCTPVDGVHHYVHQLVRTAQIDAAVTAADFAQPLQQHTDDTQCRWDLSTLPVGTYAWRVASVRMTPEGVADRGPFAAPHALRIAPPPVAPSADALELATPNGVTTVHWPGEPGYRYRLQALATPDATTPQLETMLDAPTWAAQGLPAGTWFIRIQAQDPLGLQSAFSAPRRIEVRPVVRAADGSAVGTGTGTWLEHP